MSTDIQNIQITIAVPPRRLGNERHAIEDKLNGLISKYIPEADGVLTKWSDLEVLTRHGIICDDQPYTFYKVAITSHIFRPVVGKLLCGRVSKILTHYFILKAVESFSATVAIPEEFKDHDLIKNLMVDQQVYFRFMGSCEGAFRGELDDECIELTNKIVERQIEMDAEDSAYNYAKDFEY